MDRRKTPTDWLFNQERCTTIPPIYYIDTRWSTLFMTEYAQAQIKSWL